MNSPNLLSVLEVPWMLSPSGSVVRVTQTEHHLASIQVVVSKGRHASPLMEELSPCVELFFTDAYWVSSYPVPDHASFDTERFDGSALWLESLPTSTYFDELQRLWTETGMCPDPGVYVVQNSRWCASIGRDANQLTHFLIAGRDQAVEVIARTWRWEHIDSRSSSTT